MTVNCLYSYFYKPQDIPIILAMKISVLGVKTFAVLVLLNIFLHTHSWKPNIVRYVITADKAVAIVHICSD